MPSKPGQLQYHFTTSEDDDSSDLQTAIAKFLRTMWHAPTWESTYETHSTMEQEKKHINSSSNSVGSSSKSQFEPVWCTFKSNYRCW